MEALIIEDESVSALILKRYLELLGIQSTVVATFDEGLIYLEGERRVDLIFLDLLLPGKGGLDFLRTKKKSPKCKDIPVIVASGKADISSIAEAIREGATTYLIKPFQKTLLIEALRQIERPKGADYH